MFGNLAEGILIRGWDKTTLLDRARILKLPAGLG
jgi:hypothetical protein